MRLKITADREGGCLIELEEKGIVIFTAPHRYLHEVTDSSRYFTLTVPRGLKGEGNLNSLVDESC